MSHNPVHAVASGNATFAAYLPFSPFEPLLPGGPILPFGPCGPGCPTLQYITLQWERGWAERITQFYECLLQAKLGVSLALTSSPQHILSFISFDSFSLL